MNKGSYGFVRLLLLFLCAWSVSACSRQVAATEGDTAGSDRQEQARVQKAPGASAEKQSRSDNAGNQSELLQAQTDRRQKVEVFFTARVRKLLPDDTIGLPHQRFLVGLSNNSTVLIAHDIKYAQRVPVQAGDQVTIRGEYIWNQLGGVVHWTHHSDTFRHEGGYIEMDGNRYQ